MTRRRFAMFGMVLALVAALLAAVPASPAGAATSQCTKRIALTHTAVGAIWVPAAANDSGSCWMDQSSSGNGVWALQRALVHCYGEPIAIDGDFGPKTAGALARVQKEVGAKADGVYGPQTAGRMKFSSTKSTSSKSCRGQIVKAIGGSA